MQGEGDGAELPLPPAVDGEGEPGGVAVDGDRAARLDAPAGLKLPAGVIPGILPRLFDTALFDTALFDTVYGDVHRGRLALVDAGRWRSGRRGPRADSEGAAGGGAASKTMSQASAT